MTEKIDYYIDMLDTVYPALFRMLYIRVMLM